MNRALWSIVGVVGISALLYFVMTHDNLDKIEHLEGELQRLQHENDELAEENDGLRERVKALRDDPRLAERRARETASMARPNEVIYQFASKKKPQDIEVKLVVRPDGCELAGRNVACRELKGALDELREMIPNANVVLDFASDIDAIERQRVMDDLKASEVPFSKPS